VTDRGHYPLAGGPRAGCGHSVGHGQPRRHQPV